MRLTTIIFALGLCCISRLAVAQNAQPSSPAAPPTPPPVTVQPADPPPAQHDRSAEPDEGQPEPLAFTRLNLRTNPLLDLHLLARAVAAGSADAPPIDGFDAAVTAVKSITESGGDRAWALIDSGLATCATIADARAWVAAVEREAVRPNTRLVRPTMGADQLVNAYAAIEPAFLEHVWPAHDRAIQQAIAHLRDGLVSKEHDCLADAMTSLGIADPRIRVPVYLVAHGPPPGGITYRTRDGAVCIVDVPAHAGSALDEAVLHESLHALDAAAAGQTTVLVELRDRLRGKDGRPLPGWRDVPHTVIFAQAAVTIRKLINPDHQDYGVTGGYYDRVKPAADAVRPVWAEYTAGRLSRSDTIDRIIKSYAPAPAP